MASTWLALNYQSDCGISLQGLAKLWMRSLTRAWAGMFAGQLVRSGTSAPPNYDEGCGGESRADFVHKLNISLKELRETRGWLRFIIKATLLKPGRYLSDRRCEQLCKIMAQSIITAKANAKSRQAAGQDAAAQRSRFSRP